MFSLFNKLTSKSRKEGFLQCKSRVVPVRVVVGVVAVTQLLKIWLLEVFVWLIRWGHRYGCKSKVELEWKSCDRNRSRRRGKRCGGPATRPRAEAPCPFPWFPWEVGQRREVFFLRSACLKGLMDYLTRKERAWNWVPKLAYRPKTRQSFHSSG